MIKIIAESSYTDLETEINYFISDHNVLDIQVNTHLDTWYATIIYTEVNTRYELIKEMDFDSLAKCLREFAQDMYVSGQTNANSKLLNINEVKEWLGEEI